jgi:hypothetical protein
MTNKQVIKTILRDLNDIELAILRERLLALSEAVITQKDAVREDMKRSFIHPDIYINCMEKVYNITKL